MSVNIKLARLVGRVETRIADLQRDIGHFQFRDEEHAQNGLARMGRELQRLELHRAVVRRLNYPQALMPEYMQARGLEP